MFLHGYKSSKESFFYQTEYLSERGFEVIAPDFPAFGKSAPPDKAWGVEDYSAWLEEFLGEVLSLPQGSDLPQEGVNIIAHSFGARVALYLLSSKPQYGKRLIITGGAGIVKERSPQYIRQVKWYRIIKKLFPKFAERHFGSEEYRTLSPMMRESFKRIVNLDLRTHAAKISLPTLLIYGREDKTTPPDEEGAIFHSLIADSRLEVVDGGHFCFCEQADIFNSLIDCFLSTPL